MVWNSLGESGAKGSPLALARKRLAVAPGVTAIERSRNLTDLVGARARVPPANRKALPIIVLNGTQREEPRARPKSLNAGQPAAVKWAIRHHPLRFRSSGTIPRAICFFAGLASLQCA